MFDLALFILTSARTTIDEPKRYGPRRLMEVLEKLVNLPLTNPQIPDDPFFQKIRTEIAAHPHLSSSSVVFTDEFREFIEKMIAEFIDEMKRRHQP
ncbi:MAG: DUF6092 family protein [Candidatus Bathyarchaeia archaeon]